MKKLYTLLTLLVAAHLAALQPPKVPTENGSLAAKTKNRYKPADANVVSTLAELQTRADAATNPALNRMVTAWSNAPQVLGPNTLVYLDQRTGGPAGVQPDGFPWIPGTGMNNRLTRADMAKYEATLKASDRVRDVPDANGVNQAVLERIARDFMTAHPAWFPVPQNQLQLVLLDLEPNHFVRHASFKQVVGGIEVDGARLLFSLNHGNLVSFGGDFFSPVTIATAPALTEAGAIASALRYAGVTPESLSGAATIRLNIVIDQDGGAVPGGGYTHRLVYAVTFRVPNENGTWEAEVDARTGDVIGFRDSNEYGQIVGGVQPNSNDGICPTGCEQLNYPMPFANTGLPNPNQFTDTGGNYNAATGAVTTTLNGQYVRITDTCGAISETVTAPANMNLGSGPGTDCVKPVNGNPLPHSNGDTHSTRDAFYNVNKLKEQVRGWRPTFVFNNAQVTVNVNLAQTCNAYWNGSLNMFNDAGSACRNTGEIAMIFDHELGHGYDGAESGASRPGEAFADDVASLFHHDSCIGRGFFKNQTCGGYGDACLTCTGVRGSDWTLHKGSGTITAPVPRPHTILDLQAGNQTAPNTTMECPAGTDICNFETHCAAYPITESVWDAATIDMPHNAIPVNGGAACAGTSPGNPVSQALAWNLMAKYFWLSAPTLTSQYTCVTNGTAGCGAATLFRLVKVQDDTDGNLTNGTQHAAELQCAFARHTTGCTTDTNTDQLSCPAIGTPTVTTTPGSGTVQLNWGTVAGVNTWRVLRNEESCGAGYAVIAAALPAGTLTFTDTGLQTGRTYFYQVQAIGLNAACEGTPSACVAEKPFIYTTPTLTSTTASAANQVTVSWTTGAAPAPRFNVYRDRNTCALANFNYVGNFNPTPLATLVAASPYVDNAITGAGLTYAYVVAGTGLDGLNETDRSNCLEVIPTGTCTIPPTFAGVTTATNTPGATCTITLNWTAGASICGSGSLTYNIYRSTVPGFVPSGANRIATGVAGASYVDAVGTTYNITYYYKVRAVDSVGNEETNTIEVSDKPTGTITVAYSQDFEAGAGGWAHDAANTTATTGNWVFVNPVGTAFQPEDDHTPGAGVNCMFTAQNPTGAAGIDDVDGGVSTGTSVAINTSAVPVASGVLEFWYFHGSSVAGDDGGAAGDFMFIDLSNNNGATYPTRLVNFGDVAVAPNWTKYSAPIPAGYFVTQMRLRLQVSDGVAVGDVEEGGIDDVRVYSSAACATGAVRPPEVTSTSPNAMTASKGTNPALIVLNFLDMAGAVGYNVYEGNLPIAGTYSHGGAAGNVCAAATTLAAGRRTTAAAGIGTAGSHYYLVSQYTTLEGPSGFDSSAVEIPVAQNTCAP